MPCCLQDTHWSKLRLEQSHTRERVCLSKQNPSYLTQFYLCPEGAELGIMSASSLELCQLSCELDTSLPLPRCGEQKNIDTHPFREAIWYYIHSIKGIRHDDYHYRKVPALLHHHLVDTWLHYCIRSTTSLNLWARMCCKVVSGCDPPMQYIWVPEVHFALVNGIEIHSGMVQLSDCQHSMLVCFLPLILWCWS